MPTKRKSAERDNPIKHSSVTDPAVVQSWLTARSVLRPSVQAAATLKEYTKLFGDLELGGLIDALTEQVNATTEGDQHRSEAMLTAQAHTLDAIFNTLARRAITAEHMDNLDRYLRLSLKAQSQCRATWETLAIVKNPPVIGYVRQANIANGPQQVNNSAGPDVAPRGRKAESAKQTIEGERWRTAGPRNGVHARPS